MVIDPCKTAINIGKLLLSPTRTYAPIIKKIISSNFNNISGIIHCTGGGQTKVLYFTDKLRIVKITYLKYLKFFRLFIMILHYTKGDV